MKTKTYDITSFVTYLVYKRCGNALRYLLSVDESVSITQ